MTIGPGLLLSGEISPERTSLAAATITCKDGNEYALAAGGYNGSYVTDINIYDDYNLGTTNDQLRGVARSQLAAATIKCGNDEYVLFAGGETSPDTYTTDVNVFTCNADGVSYNDSLALVGDARAPAATTIRCNDGKEYALFGGGVCVDVAQFQRVCSTNVDVFTCNENAVYHNDNLNFTGQGREYLAATTIRCGNDEYALFGGGAAAPELGSVGTIYSNNVDVFACNADGVYHKQLTQFTGSGRTALAATTIRCNDGNEYALFGGGQDATSSWSNAVDVFACNESGVYHEKLIQFTGPGRASLAAITITCLDGNQYALFGGGNYGPNISNDVDIFACNADGVYHKEVTQFTGPARFGLAATTITIDGKEYALFMGGQSGFPQVYETAMDIYDCETGSFLPQPSL